MLVTMSRFDHAETMRRLADAVAHRALTVFGLIDHAHGARQVGLELHPEEVLVFGNPRAGTGLMQADPRIGIELPLRVLVWAVADAVHIAYNDPRELAGRYDLDAAHATLDAMSELLAAVVAEAAGAPPPAGVAG
ncbi:MAG: DUF302 domain-containing protein [Solirubrobacteraceae bacterium]